MEINLQQLRQAFTEVGYIAEDNLIMTVFWALTLKKPLLIEGEPGVGKTEIAKALSLIFSMDLIRLQCYEGLDESRALYEWNYQRQLLKIHLQKDCAAESMEKDLFDPEYLLARPLLKAIMAKKRTVLLIDEIDKTDEQFEAFLFEVLSEYQVSIPEWGSIQAEHIPIVVLTSNHDRDLSDGLRRRCVYLYIDYPSIEKEVAILEQKIPDINRRLAQEIGLAIQWIRKIAELEKKPAISETLDWARALVTLSIDKLEPRAIDQTLGLIFKNENDLRHFKEKVGSKRLCEEVKAHLAGERRD